jgi:hypothetical protein
MPEFLSVFWISKVHRSVRMEGKKNGYFFKKNMPREKKHHGVGAVCSVLVRNLHSKPVVAAKFPNAVASQRLEGLLCIRQETKLVNHKQVMCFVFRHDLFDDVELHCLQRWSKVTEEGSPEHFFGQHDPAEEVPDEGKQGDLEMPMLEGNEYDLVRLQAEGYEIDDDNEPAPENAPNATPPNIMGVRYGDWGFSGICQRRAEGLRADGARLRKISSDLIGALDVVTMFVMFMPKHFFESIILVESNKVIQGPPITFGEFLQFIGIWLYMATTAGFSRSDWFSGKKIDRWEGAPCRFNDVMSGRRFEAIIAALRFTATPAPTFQDKFHEVRDLIFAWNNNMTDTFSPSWVSCLDESMSKWTSRWTCPGFMYVPRKPWPMGNEYHSVCCALSGIMYSIELVEGKDRPRQLGPAQFDSLGKTVGLMWRMCKPIFHSGKVVILDSGFCVLQGIIELKKVGVYAVVLIKK